MTFVEKAQSFIILAAVFVGLALGHVPVVDQNAAIIIVPLLMLMLTGVFLPPGSYEYAFLVDNNQIVPDPEAAFYKSDSFGSRNSILFADASDEDKF